MRLIPYVPALVAAALGCQAAPPPDTSASAKQAIDAANAQWPRLTSTGHADSIAEFYAADAVIMPPNMATMRGKDAVRAFFDHQYDRPAPHPDPPCRDGGGQRTGGRRDRAVALGLRRRRQVAAGHARRGLGQVHRALGTAKRTLAHGGRRLEQRLAIAHGSCCTCAGTG